MQREREKERNRNRDRYRYKERERETERSREEKQRDRDRERQRQRDVFHLVRTWMLGLSFGLPIVACPSPSIQEIWVLILCQGQQDIGALRSGPCFQAADD